MPEPDFDQLARRLVDMVERHVAPFIPNTDDPVRQMVIRQITKELAQLWEDATWDDPSRWRAFQGNP